MKTSRVHLGRMVLKFPAQAQALLTNHDAVASYFLSSGHALPSPGPFFLSLSFSSSLFKFSTLFSTREDLFLLRTDPFAAVGVGVGRK